MTIRRQGGSGRDASVDLTKDSPDRTVRRPFHWPLEFPEAFLRENGGFDAFIGNPPFVGGKRISTVSGPAYNDWLVLSHAGSRKNSDLVAHFFRRGWSFLRQGGCLGFLATNSIAEGDTRQGGLEWMLHDGAVIVAAYPNEAWPGRAAVITSRVHVHRGKWGGIRRLFDREVQYISAFLSEGEEWSPKGIALKRWDGFSGFNCSWHGFCSNCR
ncbi:MAG: hypothetical protein KatS3mg082_2297 [Nitrospiraceae bacterium]|nr:MAG: hypothetical protein KatS3mg082_2297 [Nitrospiraceae bacterium]